MSALGKETYTAAAVQTGSLDSGHAIGPISSSVPHRIGKRALDIAVSGTLLLVLLPPVVLIAIAVLLESPGPVLFRSPRVGRDGDPFAMLKFRKMKHDAEGLPLTTATDTRYTRIGSWLTKTKLDEIPQLWNVFRGDMTLVGPRPEDPRLVAEREHEYGPILAVKQGVTGLSQLAFFEEARILDPDDPLAHYRARIWPQKMALDQLYAGKATVAWDLRILCWTMVSCLLRKPVAVNRATGALSLRRR